MSIHTRILNTVSIPLNTMSMSHNTVGVALSTVNMPLSIFLYSRNIPHIYLSYCERTPGYYEYAYMNTMTLPLNTVRIPLDIMSIPLETMGMPLNTVSKYPDF